MPLRKPLTDGEREQVKYLFESLIKFPTISHTPFTIASSLAISQRQARRELGALAEHNLVTSSEPRNCTDPNRKREYAARRDPHAQRGYEALFGEPMPENWRL